MNADFGLVGPCVSSFSSLAPLVYWRLGGAVTILLAGGIEVETDIGGGLILGSAGGSYFVWEPPLRDCLGNERM